VGTKVISHSSAPAHASPPCSQAHPDAAPHALPRAVRLRGHKAANGPQADGAKDRASLNMNSNPSLAPTAALLQSTFRNGLEFLRSYSEQEELRTATLSHGHRAHSPPSSLLPGAPSTASPQQLLLPYGAQPTPRLRSRCQNLYSSKLRFLLHT